MYEYNCTIVRVIDGDTTDVDIDLGFGLQNFTQTLKVKEMDMDLPEDSIFERLILQIYLFY